MWRYERLAGAGPMHTASSAKRTWSARASTSECTATVLMPSSLQARTMRSAISPRLAMRILRNTRLRFLEAEELLAVLDRFAVLHEDLDDGTRDLGLDLVHQLHRLDDAESLTRLHDRSDVGEDGSVRRRRAIERADEGRGHLDVILVVRLDDGR